MRKPQQTEKIRIRIEEADTLVRGDVLSPEQRRRCMSRNKGRDTAPELELRRVCWSRLGLRYRVNLKAAPLGKPDFWFPNEKVAVFVDGCFWHGCPVHYVAPATRSDFWQSKLEANRNRDALVTASLAREGWEVLRFWEHEVRTPALRLEKATLIHDVVLARRHTA